MQGGREFTKRLLLAAAVLALVGTAEAFLGQPSGSPCTFRRSHVSKASVSLRPLINLPVENRAHQWKMCQSGGGEGSIGGEDDSEAVKAFRLKKLLKKSSVFLIGMDGSGKNEIGQELASAIGYRFVETNGIISQLSGGRPVDDALLAEMGEESWVQVERQVMDAVQAYMSTIVATGSVAPLDMENWAKFRTGLVVYLRTSEEGLKKEGIQVALQSEPNSLAPGVPSKNAALMPLILAQREAVYSQADVTVDVNGMSTTDAVAKLSEAITDFIVANPAPEKAKLSEAHAQALSRILSEEEGEEDKDKRPAGSDVPRDEIDQLYKMFDKAGEDGGDGESLESGGGDVKK